MNKDKYLQIFNYLLEFSKLRSKPIRDIENSEQYPESERVWLADIPECEIFDCIIFPHYNQDADYWVKITKPVNEPKPPKFPELTPSLTEWINKDSLINGTAKPFLNESIIKKGEVIHLSAQSHELKKEFDHYLNSQWNIDLKSYQKKFKEYKIKHDRYKEQNETYRQFFNIHTKVQQFSDINELVFAVGLLYFQENTNTPRICRHILTLKAEISFVNLPNETLIKVFPSTENEIYIETDAILDLANQFNPATIIDAENKIKEQLKNLQISNLFSQPIVDLLYLLHGFVNTIHPDGDETSINELLKPKDIPTRPSVYLAPALFLRKRNTKSLTAVYENIIKNLDQAETGINIPAINDIIGIASEAPATLLNDDTIYFPKAYNDEQIEIINRLRIRNKVLVQGPPGTGKSHTIANLICHLLANGKKTLVTAQNKNTLEVLKISYQRIIKI